jgi:magnesium transporter
MSNDKKERITLSEELIEKIKRLVSKNNVQELRRIIYSMKPADVADLIEHLSSEERMFIFKILEPDGAGEVLIEVEPPIQESIIEKMDNQALSEIVETLDSDDAADLVGYLPEDRAKKIIESVGKDVSEELKKLLPYPEDTAGGIMALEFVAVKADATIKDAIEEIKQKKDEIENLYHIWVIDSDGKLVGVVSIKDLLLEPPEKKIKEIMNPDVIYVNVYTDQEEVARLFKKYDLVSIPVVDENNRLVGRITYDDIIDVIEEEVDEDLSIMAGIVDQEIAEESPFKISRARLPWLVISFIGELVSAIVINRFEASIQKIIALSFFFPVIMALGGATSQQAAIIVVRGLATGDISVLSLGRRILVELKSSLLIGMILGILLGGVVSVWLSNWHLGIVIACALMIIILNAGFIGSAVPIALYKMNIDPAFATGPFVATTNDILGLLIYLSLVTWFLRTTAT